MHPILRIFDYQTDASLTVIGPTESYDQGGGRWGARPAILCRANLVGESAYRIMQGQGCQDQHYGQCDGLCERMFHQRMLHCD